MVDTGRNAGKTALVVALVVVAISGCVLVGWLLGVEFLKRIAPGFNAMNPASAVAFFLAGASLTLFLRPPPGRGQNARVLILTARLCALAVTLIGTARLIAVFGGWDLGVDRWLFASKLPADPRLPDRMPPNAALNFLLLGGALLLVDVKNRSTRFCAELAVVVVGFVSLLAVLGYAYGIRSFSELSAANPMALHTAITFLALVCAFLLSHTDDGLLAVFAGDSAGGTLARRLLPAAVLVPVVLGWLTQLGEEAGIYREEFGEAVFAVGNVLVFTLLVGWSAKRLFHADRRRQKAEEAVRESEERFSGAFEHAPIGMGLVLPDGHWLKVNRTLCDLIGYTEWELLTRTFQDITHPDDLAACIEIVRRLIKGEISSYQSEKRYVHKQGQFVPVSFNLSLVRDGQGQPLYVIAQIQDITERQRAASALLESKRFLQSALDALSSHIAILDEQGTIVEVNAAWNRVAGDNDFVDRPYGVGDNYFQVCDAASNTFPQVASQEASTVASGIRAVMTGQSDEFHLEYPCHSPRERRWFLLRVTRFGGEGPVRVVVAHENITELKLADEELRWKTAFLEAQVNSSLDGVLVVGGQGKKLLQNQRFTDLLKIPQDIADDIDDQDQIRWVTEMTANPERFIEKVIHLYAHPGETSRDEIELKGGAVLDRYSAPVIGKDGSYYGRIWLFRDITEQRRAEAAIRAQAYMLDNIGQAVVSTDPGGQITYANRFAEKLYGWSHAEMVGQNILDVTVPPASRGQAEGILAQLQKGENWSGELLVQHRDGTVFPALTTSTQLRGRHGEVIGIVGISEDISSRKRAQEDLQRSEMQHRRLAEQLAVEKARLDDAQAVAKLGSWETDLATGVVTWSDETYRIFDAAPGNFEPTHQNLLKLVHPDDRDMVHDAFSRSLASQADCAIEHRVLMPDGPTKIVEERWQPFFDGRGQPTRIFGTCQDITERRKTEAALREAEAKYRSIFENSNDGIFQNTPDGRFLSANPALARILGFASPEELIRERTDLAHQGYAEPALRKEFQRRLEERGFINAFEYEVQRKDGSRIWVSENTRIVRDAAGQALYYEGSVQDITARKHAEEELFRSRATLRGILDNVPQLIFWKDRDLVYQGCNLALALEMGFQDPSEVIGKTDFDASWKALAELYRADDRRVIDLDTPKIGFEEPLVAANGFQSWVRTTKIPLHDQQGRVVGVLGTSEDVTEYKRAKLEIERLNADLEQRVAQRTEALFVATREAERANAAKSEFLSRTSHELRTPMNAILGFGQLLEMEKDLGPAPRESVEQILNAGRHLLTLIDELLDISNAESGAMLLALAPVAVDPLGEEMLALVRPLGATLRVEVELASPLKCNCQVLADPQRLKQALLNLLSNAIKYNREGGKVTLERGLVEAADPPVFRFCVKDTGPGISAENLARLFIPFDRLDAERTQTHIIGTGLGLTLSKRMVELMGGTLGVESVVGEGSTFWIELPIAPPASSQA